MALQGAGQAALRWVRVGSATKHHIRWDLGSSTVLEFFKLVLDLLIFFIIVEEIIRWDCFTVSHGLELLLGLLFVDLVSIVVALLVLKATEVIWRSLFCLIWYYWERIFNLLKSFWWRSKLLYWSRGRFERIEEIIWVSKIYVQLLCVQWFNLIILLHAKGDATEGSPLTVVLNYHFVCLLLFLWFTDLNFNLLYNRFLLGQRVLLRWLSLLVRNLWLILHIQSAERIFYVWHLLHLCCVLLLYDNLLDFLLSLRHGCFNLGLSLGS